MQPLDTVLALLDQAGFRLLEMPFVIGGAAFEFDAALVATGHSQDLVVVVGPRAERQRTAEMLGGMNRALDMLASRRPVTVVLVGEPPPRETLRRIQDSARLLNVGDTDSEEAIGDSLAVLLPLDLPQAGAASAPPLDGLVHRLGKSGADEVAAIVRAATQGHEAVRAAMRDHVEAAFDSSSGTT